MSCTFDWPSHDSNWFSAADDISRLIVNISYNNPNDNFYIIGNNDLDTLKYQRKQELFPHNNVFNTYNNKKKLGEKYHHSGWKTPLEYLNKKLFANSLFPGSKLPVFTNLKSFKVCCTLGACPENV